MKGDELNPLEYLGALFAVLLAITALVLVAGGIVHYARCL